MSDEKEHQNLRIEEYAARFPNDDALHRWVFRALVVVCSTILLGELMGLVLS